jgi:large subunit ribosomal protein L30
MPQEVRAMAGHIKVTLVRSGICRTASQRRTLVALGLGKLNSFVVCPDNPAVRGAIEKVQHLVSFEDVQ